MKIAIRMDDITPDMDWEKFYFFRDSFRRLGITPLIGIVPCNKDAHLSIDEPNEHFWEEMRTLQAEGWSIALHGCHHVYHTSCGGIFPLNHFSEFAGRSYEEQSRDITCAQKVMEEHGIYTDIFMAPAHSYDKVTLRVLAEHGYTKITDGFGSRPYRYQGMTFYPISFLLSRSFQKKNGCTTWVIHANTVDDISHYERLFEEHKDKLISYSEYLDIQAHIRHLPAALGEYLMAVAKHGLVKMKG